MSLNISISPFDQVALFLQVLQEVQFLPWDQALQQVPPDPPNPADPDDVQEVVREIGLVQMLPFKYANYFFSKNLFKVQILRANFLNKLVYLKGLFGIFASMFSASTFYSLY